MFVGYAVASHVDADLDAQVRALAWVGCGRIFTEVITSVKSAHRPGLRSVLDYLRMDDTLVILQCKRLALPVKQLLGLLVMLEGRGVAFQSLNDQIDSTTPEGQMIWRMFLGLARFDA